MVIPGQYRANTLNGFYMQPGMAQAEAILDTVQGLLAQGQYQAIARYLLRLEPLLLSQHAQIVGATKLNRLEKFIPEVYETFSAQCQIQLRHRKTVSKSLTGFHHRVAEAHHNVAKEFTGSDQPFVPPQSTPTAPLVSYSKYAEAEVATAFDLSTGVKPQGYVSTFCGIKEHTAQKYLEFSGLEAAMQRTPLHSLS